MKKVYALVRSGGTFIEFKDSILLFESEKSRDKKLETIISDLESEGWYINNNYGDHNSYNCQSDLLVRMKYGSFTWTKVTLNIEEAE